MTDEIDKLIGGCHDGLAQLDRLEDKVWVRIGERREQVRMGQVRGIAMALAVVVGVANGGFMLLAPRSEPSEMRVFTVSAGLSPIAGLDIEG